MVANGLGIFHPAPQILRPLSFRPEPNDRWPPITAIHQPPSLACSASPRNEALLQRVRSACEHDSPALSMLNSRRSALEMWSREEYPGGSTSYRLAWILALNPMINLLSTDVRLPEYGSGWTNTLRQLGLGTSTPFQSNMKQSAPGDRHDYWSISPTVARAE